jgi:hypothetical protein
MIGTAKATVFVDNERVIVTEYRFQPGQNTAGTATAMIMLSCL